MSFRKRQTGKACQEGKTLPVAVGREGRPEV